MATVYCKTVIHSRNNCKSWSFKSWKCNGKHFGKTLCNKQTVN